MAQNLGGLLSVLTSEVLYIFTIKERHLQIWEPLLPAKTRNEMTFNLTWQLLYQ